MVVFWGTPFNPLYCPSKEERKAERNFMLSPLRSTSLNLGLSPLLCNIFPPVFSGQCHWGKKTTTNRNLEAHTKQGNICKSSFLVFFSWAPLIDSVRLYFQFRPENTSNSSLASRIKNSFMVLPSKKLLKLVFILSDPLPCTKKGKTSFSN